MARLHYSNNPITKAEYIKRKELKHYLKKRLLIISLLVNAVLVSYVIIKGL